MMPAVWSMRLIFTPASSSTMRTSVLTASAELTVGTSMRKCAPSGKRASEVGRSQTSPEG